jgi:hypothetical protein
MKIKLEVTMEVSLLDMDTTETVDAKTALEAAKEGVEEALENTENRGFNHRHSDIVGLAVLGVKPVK